MFDCLHRLKVTEETHFDADSSGEIFGVELSAQLGVKGFRRIFGDRPKGIRQ
jgi:hypothetical protein